MRLSEAVARLHLDRRVTQRYVLEAHALLKKSLVHADSGSRVELGEEEWGAGEDEEGGEGGGGGGGGGGGH